MDTDKIAANLMCRTPCRLNLTGFLIFLGERYRGLFRWFVMVSLFGIPFGLSGMYLQTVSGVKMFPRSVFFGYLWLTFAPVLIWSFLWVLNNFFHSIRFQFTKERLLVFVQETADQFFSHRHLLLSFPLAAAFAYVAYGYGFAAGLPPAGRQWLTLMMAVLGFVSGIGFWEIIVLGKLVARLQRENLEVDFSHPDMFGGLRPVGSLLVVGTALFYSGSLLIPFGVEAMSIAGYTRVEAVTVIVLIAYILLGLANFIVGVYRIHNLVYWKKVEIDRVSGERFNKLMNDNLFGKGADLGGVLKPLVYYHTYHSRIGEMKEYPYDPRTIMELLASVLIPVAVFLLDHYLG